MTWAPDDDLVEKTARAMYEASGNTDYSEWQESGKRAAYRLWATAALTTAHSDIITAERQRADALAEALRDCMNYLGPDSWLGEQRARAALAAYEAGKK